MKKHLISDLLRILIMREKKKKSSKTLFFFPSRASLENLYFYFSFFSHAFYCRCFTTDLMIISMIGNVQ